MLEKTQISQKLSLLLVTILLLVSCLNMLIWDFFFLFRQYLVLVFIVCNVLLILLNYQKVINQHRGIFFLGAFALLFYVCSSAFYDAFSIQEGGSGLLLLNLILSLICFNSLSFPYEKIKFLLRMVGIFSFIYLAFHFFHQGYYNTNTLGTFSFILLVYVLLWLEPYTERLWVKLIVFSLFISFDFYQRCRSGLVGELVFLLLLLFPFWTKKVLFRFFVIGLNLVAIALPPLWVKIWLSGFVFKIPLVNKGLYSGRERVWEAFLSVFYEHPFIGSGSGILKIPLKHYAEFTAHNFLLGILTVYGLIVFAAVFIMLVKILYEKRDEMMSANVSILPLAGLLGILVTSYFEIIPISYIHSVMIWFLLVIINSKVEDAIKSGEKV